MKKTELQIGDWYLASKQHSTIYGDYTLEFYPKKLTIDDLIFANNNDWDDCDWDEFTKPIPLTAEILEKNGFKKTTDEKYYMCDDYSELSAEEYSDSIWLICCSDIECNLPVQKIMVSYIHQLQQFLRLCGLNELADNFKFE